MRKDSISFFLRHTKHVGNIFISVLLALGIVILLEIITYNHNLFFDLTLGKVHTFSEQTQNILESLEKDVEFISFYRMGDRQGLEDFFSRLCNHSNKLKYELVDLERNPGKARLYGVSHVQTVVKYDGRTRVIGYATEERVVNAILKLTKGINKTVYFTKGHGEVLEYSDLKKSLKTENWSVAELYLLHNQEIPINETVVVAAGPKNDFQESEILILEQYLRKGGRIMVMIEPFTTLPNLEGFLKKYRISVGEGIIVDRQNTLSGGDYLSPLVSYKYQCPVTQGLGPSSSFVFPTVRSVEPMVDGAEGIMAYPLLRTSRSSWSKIDKEELKKGAIDFAEGVDTPGPLGVAVWARVQIKGEANKAVEGEMICIGDSDFVANRHYDKLANKDFFLNSMEWLAKDSDLISIRPRKAEFPFHFLSASQSWMLFVISIILLPLTFLVSGITLFVFRRVRG